MPAPPQRVLNKKLSQIFRMRGLSVRPDAMEPLYAALNGVDEWEATLQAILAEVQLQTLKGGHVDARAVSAAIESITAREGELPALALDVVNAFDMPALKWDTQRRALMAEGAPTSMHAAATSKSSMYTLRLAALEQRVKRNDLFKPPLLASGVNAKEYLSITSIDALLGRSGTRVILGMLSELEEGQFFLEDSRASIALDLSDAGLTSGLFTRQSIVLAEGEVLASGVFKVSQLGFPPPEARQLSIDSLGTLDPLRHSTAAPTAGGPATVAGGKIKTRLHTSATGEATAGSEHAMMVVLSDLWLDKPAVLSQLAKLLAGYEAVGSELIGRGDAAVPLASFFTFVLCGNFASSAHAAATASRSQLTDLFKELSRAIAKAPTLAKHAHFVLVPGPDDATVGAAAVLPRAPIPAALTAELRNVAAHLELASSPARLQLCGQDVCIHRDELLVKARRACVMPPSEADDYDLNQHLLKTVIDQAHLCPLPPSEAPIYWQHDASLWLHPAPDVLILADRQAQFQHEYEQTLAFNPGNFASDLSWYVYKPASRELEPSSLAAE